MSAYITILDDRSIVQAAIQDISDAGRVSVNNFLDAVAANSPFSQNSTTLQGDKPILRGSDRKKIDYLILGLVSVLVHYTVVETFTGIGLSQEAVVPPETPARVMITLSRPQPKPQQPVSQPVVVPPPVQKAVPLKPTKPKPVEKVLQQTPTPVNTVEPSHTPVESPAPVAKAEPLEEKVTPPSAGADYLHNPAPEYPEVAMDRGWEGKVLMKVHVKPDGKPDEVSVISSSGQRILDDAAIKTVNKWMFVPASKGGSPIAGWVTVPITFNLS